MPKFLNVTIQKVLHVYQTSGECLKRSYGGRWGWGWILQSTSQSDTVIRL